MRNRETLNQQSAALKRALTENLDDLKLKSEDFSKAALIGGGILFAGYLVYRVLSSKHDNDYNEYIHEKSDKIVVVNPPQESVMLRAIKHSIATFLLAIARQKLIEYLNKKEREYNAKNT